MPHLMIVANSPEKLAKDKYSIRSHGFLGVFRFFFRSASAASSQPSARRFVPRHLQVSAALGRGSTTLADGESRNAPLASFNDGLRRHTASR